MINPMNLSLPSSKHSSALMALAIALGMGAYTAYALNAPDNHASSAEGQVRTVAWYVANIAEAKAVNRTCFQGDSALMQESEDCQNALKALNMAHISRNYQN